MATRSNIGIKNSDGSIEMIYCHWDGYPDNQLPILTEHYNTEDKVRELLALGDISVLAERVKPNKNERAPQVYFVTGVVVGVIVTLAVTAFISILLNLSTPKDDIVIPKKSAAETSGKFSFIPADNQNKGNVQTEISNQQYTVKEGDTLESIVIRFYGSFDMSKVNAIQDANQMANPNALSIGQKLIIPMN